MSIALALAAGLMLRLWMLKTLFQVNGDSLIYGGIAKNLLLHGRYALTAGGEVYPTLIRLPGYPLFLAACFRLFGMENYVAVCWVEIALELVGCLLLADFARRVAPPALSRAAAHGTLWLAALCPFTASYAAAPLTEAPTLFAIALALWSMVRFREQPRWSYAFCFTLSVTFAALLRPDGALVAVALAPALILGLGWTGRFRLVSGHDLSRAESFSESTGALAPAGHLSGTRPNRRPSRPAIVRMALVCTLLALLPFAAWTWRNWRTFQVFEPLAPRLATDPGEDTHPGWERWVKTWCLDFVSTYEVYWNVPGDSLDLSALPPRAFDSPAQYAETAALAGEYNGGGQSLTRQLDAHFGKLAEERIAAHPFRFYLWLPLGRHVAPATRREPAHRPRLVGLCAPPRGDSLQLGLRRAECTFSAAWSCRAVPAATLLGSHAGLLSAAQRPADHRRGSGGPLHAGVLPDAVCAGRNRADLGMAESAFTAFPVKQLQILPLRVKDDSGSDGDTPFGRPRPFEQPPEPCGFLSYCTTLCVWLVVLKVKASAGSG
jgi:hypothetical protein